MIGRKTTKSLYMRARDLYIEGVGSTQHRVKPGFEAEAGGKGVMDRHGVRATDQPHPVGAR